MPKDGGFNRQRTFEARAGPRQVALGLEHVPQFVENIGSVLISFCKCEAPLQHLHLGRRQIP